MKAPIGDHVGVCDVGELGALLGEWPDEVSERLIGLLPAALEVPGVSRTHVCALEVSDEDPDCRDSFSEEFDSLFSRIAQQRKCNGA
jgi:hypothetical protein